MIALGGNELLAFYPTLVDVDHPQESCAEYSAIPVSITQKNCAEENTYSPKRKANGMLSLFPDAVMIALETKGPINAEVFPT